MRAFPRLLFLLLLVYSGSCCEWSYLWPCPRDTRLLSKLAPARSGAGFAVGPCARGWSVFAGTARVGVSPEPSWRDVGGMFESTAVFKADRHSASECPRGREEE